jgi:hypothetical protein
MKKIFLTLAAATSLAFTAKAQVTFIPKAGVTFSNVALKDEIDGQGSTVGFLFGAGFNLPLDADGFFSIQPELLYIQKGFGLKGTDTSTGYTVTFDTDNHFNYLELPVLAKISFGSETIKGYVNAGPSIGYALSGKTKGTATIQGQSQNIDEKADLSAGNRADFGLQFGGGIGFQAGPGSILLDLRYGYGLSNLEKESSGSSSGDNKSQNRVIAVSVGYAIPLGGK